MLIGGLQKFTLLDYPGEVAAIIFTQGCNFRCHFCYNPMLVGASVSGESTYPLAGGLKDHQLSEDDLFEFLESRQGKLTGLVITGGEPTLHKDLPEFLQKLKAMGFKIKLDTNGTNPETLKRIITDGLADYVAMDIKAAPEKYTETAGVKVDMDRIKKSIDMIMGSGLPYEFRTTVVPGFFEKDDIMKIGDMIPGAEAWYLQQFKSDVDLVDPEFQGQKAYTDRELKSMAKKGREYVKKCEVR